MILLIAATLEETRHLRRRWPRSAPLPGGFPCFFPEAENGDPALTITGVGKANAAAATALALDRFRPRLAVNFGCGGAFPASDLSVGDLALATSEHYGDDGVETPAGFLAMKDLGLPLAQGPQGPLYNEFTLESPWLSPARASLAEVANRRGCRWREGAFVTVSSCSGSDDRSRRISARSGALCESMEGAAVAHMCALFAVPLVEIRGISNLTGDRDPAAWNLAAANTAAQEAVAGFLARIPAEDRP